VEHATGDDTPHQDRNRVHALPGDKRDHNWNKGKRCALHDRQARANRTYADRLKQRRDPGKEHGHLYHVDHLREIRAV